MTLNHSATTSSAFDFAAFESGQLNETETIEFFQELIDTGRVWRLQGHYGRVAIGLINAGKVHARPGEPYRLLRELHSES